MLTLGSGILMVEVRIPTCIGGHSSRIDAEDTATVTVESGATVEVRVMVSVATMEIAAGTVMNAGAKEIHPTPPTTRMDRDSSTFRIPTAM